MKAALLLLIFFLGYSSGARAQLCSGSLGDPILNETFGTSRDPLPFTKTTFEYRRGCPDKGQYTLANLIFGCGEDRSWLMLAGDHTRDVNGSYMLVNAQSGDGVPLTATVYTDTARGLCIGITYVFAAWITNALRPISCGGNAVPASATLKVTTLGGVVLGTVVTGNFPIEDDKKWNQYGLSFQLPAGEDAVVLTILTERKAGCGQGFAIDDITLTPCGPEVTATINGSAGPMDVCADFAPEFVLQGTYAAGFSTPSIQWQRSLDTGKTWTDIAAATSSGYTAPRQPEGVILYRMAVAEAANIRSPQCRFLSNVIYTSVHPVPPHQAPQNLLGCLGKDMFLPAKDSYAHHVVWTGPNGFSSTNEEAVVPAISLVDTGLYLRQQDFGFGCFSLDSFYVQVFPSTTLSVPPVYSVCEGKGVRLAATGEGTFLWQPATGLSNPRVADPVASPHDSTLYKVVVTNSFGCKDSALVVVNVFRNPEVIAGPDRTIVRGDTVLLNGAVRGTAIQYVWSPSVFINNATALSPQVFPTSDMQFTLTATSTVGCGKAEAVVSVKVYDDIYIPDAFSPNNDGKNDAFKIIAADGYQLLNFRVFNRWGQVIYQSKDFSKGWDGQFNGQPQPQDTYVYYLQIRSSNGRTITKKGTLTLVR